MKSFLHESFDWDRLPYDHLDLNGQWSKSEQDVDALRSRPRWTKHDHIPSLFDSALPLYYEAVPVPVPPTIYEEMNGPVDPNDTVSNSSPSTADNKPMNDEKNSSDSDSEKPTHEKYSPHVIFDMFKTVLIPSKTPEQVILQSLMFIDRMFPNELLAKSIEELQSTDSEINLFQIRIFEELNTQADTPQEQLALMTFQCAIYTYNYITLLDVKDPHVIVTIFMEGPQK